MKKPFSVKTVLMLADQLLTTIEGIHNSGFLHLNLSMDSLAMGAEDMNKRLYVIGFSNVVPVGVYAYAELQNPLPINWFSSTQIHEGEVASKKDDLEAIGYLLVYMLTRKLPWSYIKGKIGSKEADTIYQIKSKTDLNVLCRECPHEILNFMKYVKSLSKYTDPDYDRCRKMLKQKFVDLGLNLDYVYDWTFRLSLEDEEESKSVISSSHHSSHQDLKINAAEQTGKSVFVGMFVAIIIHNSTFHNI